jgi:hypothetical protein
VTLPEGWWGPMITLTGLSHRFDRGARDEGIASLYVGGIANAINAIRQFFTTNPLRLRVSLPSIEPVNLFTYFT